MNQDPGYANGTADGVLYDTIVPPRKSSYSAERADCVEIGVIEMHD